LEQPAVKKRRKFYNIIPAHWNLGDKIEKKKYEASEEVFRKLGDETDIEEMKTIVKDSRDYLCVQFKTLDVQDHILLTGNSGVCHTDLFSCLPGLSGSLGGLEMVGSQHQWRRIWSQCLW
jgi:hypothetical protein